MNQQPIRDKLRSLARARCGLPKKNGPGLEWEGRQERSKRLAPDRSAARDDPCIPDLRNRAGWCLQASIGTATEAPPGLKILRPHRIELVERGLDVGQPDARGDDLALEAAGG